ncbi:MAG: sigma-70 family RNA polymerase sigma factor [Calditrichaeota bacterium]|nr:sigma-70 family RNA polymerase sigma factor [Calditrichota bacterium]
MLNKKQSLESYYREIGEVKLLTPEEEIELARRIKQNDQKALKKLVSANLRFVVSVAKSYQNHGLSLEDLINEGNLGLIKAAYRFDETRGFKFISYAVWWIRQAILQAIAEKTRMIRLPLNRVSTLTKISKVYSKLEQEFERSPTNEEIGNMLEMNSDEISNTIRKASRVASIDSPIISNSNSRLIDIIQDEDELRPDSKLIDESLRDEVKHMLEGLTSRESKILKLYFGLDGNKAKTLEEVGMEFRLTRERVRQIKEKALNKLRKNSRSEVLSQYLG